MFHVPGEDPRVFPTEGWVVIEGGDGNEHILEEEALPAFKDGLFCPIHIGHVYVSRFSRYQVVGKMGFDETATYWLARDLKYYDPNPEP
jgi:hypothetical protein